ncbi:MAG TPA: DUF3618 domain-containing protein [Candidatus Saccharimonadales bacterium]|nr:DUF3618 domain-containing protein [Candidatus Saccharimonadales bacterium]
MTDDRQMTDDERGADPGTGDETEREIEARVADIESTRQEMTSTVEVIGERLDPANIIQDAKETVREATVGKVETMAQDASSMVGSTAQQAGAGIVETIKQNPIPAAMAGIGIGWLLTHRSSGSDQWGRSSNGWSSRDRYGYDRRGTAYRSGEGSSGTQDWSTQSGVQDRVGEVAGSVGERLGSVGDTVGERLGSVGDTMGEVPQMVGQRAQGVGTQAQRLIEQSPLAVGAVAVAVGAAIGLVLPSTEVEQQVLGSTSEKLLSTAEQTATQAMRQAREGDTSPSSEQGSFQTSDQGIGQPSSV